MKVLITGSEGFIGKNLKSRLNEMEDIEIITFDKDDNFSKIENNINEINFIFHFAGINRPVNVEEYYTGNSDLTLRLTKLIKENNENIPIIITSSIQATSDNDYGKSKKLSEENVIKNCKNAYVYRLHNVFGKWCKPNYNSVIATFCHNIANNLEIKVNDENIELELVYIDDVINEFIDIMRDSSTKNKNEICYINKRYKYTLGEIVNLLNEFKSSMKSIYVPATGNEFIKKLYSTYISYVPLNEMANETIKNVDERGSFIELIRTEDSGQFSISISKPGIVRGNHYHHTKIERFVVIKGSAAIKFRNIIDNTTYEFIVSDDKIQIITIPVGYTHSIENIGNNEMILGIWCNELFDKDYQDTYFNLVEPIKEERSK